MQINVMLLIVLIGVIKGAFGFLWLGVGPYPVERLVYKMICSGIVWIAVGIVVLEVFPVLMNYPVWLLPVVADMVICRKEIADLIKTVFVKAKEGGVKS